MQESTVSTPHQDDSVTVVIATYNRPELLKVAIMSIQYQTHKNWVAHVIGDNCDERTGNMIAELNDSRVKYYNNQLRFGEQSGGNSIGLALAKSKYVAFLNHDDIWSPNHLETAIDEIKKKGIGFYMGRSLFCRDKVDGIPDFDSGIVNAHHRDPSWAFYLPFYLFEPCSTWVLTNESSTKIGLWKQSITIYRIPIINYVMRAWRSRITFGFGEKITVVKCNFHQHSNGIEKEYLYNGGEQDQIYQMLSDDAETILTHKKKRPELYETRSIWVKGKLDVKELIYLILVNKFTAQLYYFTGIDLYEVVCLLSGKKKGYQLLEALKNRTGETSMKVRSLPEIIDQAKKSGNF